jgi:hypothetical protein
MIFRPLQFIRDERGAAAAEFAIVALIAIALIVGVIDMGRFAYELNSAKAATRAGARTAVVNAMVSQTYANYDAIADSVVGGNSTYYAGERLPSTLPVGLAGALDTCTSTACSLGGRNATAFTTIVTAMQGYYGRIQPANVVVEYRYAGVGVAGTPDAPDVSPLVTVKIQNMTFAPGVLQVFGMAPFLLPSMATTLSGEDLQ